MIPNITKTDKIHLFDDRNLKSLIRLYNWTGHQQKQQTKNNKNNIEESFEFDDVNFVGFCFYFF